MQFMHLALAYTCISATACYSPNLPANGGDTEGAPGEASTSKSETDNVDTAVADEGRETSSSVTSDSPETGTTDGGDTVGATADGGSTTSGSAETTTTGGSSGDVTSETGEPVETRLVFVSQEVFPGGVTQAASALCQDRAEAAGLPGTYAAWISLGGASPDEYFDQFDGPYVLTTGEVIADDWDDLVDGGLDHAINRDENGDLAVGINVWTNTGTDGSGLAGGPDNCTNFTSVAVGQTAPIGRTTANNSQWTDYDTLACNAAAHIYCFEQ